MLNPYCMYYQEKIFSKRGFENITRSTLAGFSQKYLVFPTQKGCYLFNFSFLKMVEGKDENVQPRIHVEAYMYQ